MKKSALLPFFLLLLAAEAKAYLPPSYYIYQHLAESRVKQSTPAVLINVSRPLAASTEESLGTIPINAIRATEGGWPALSLLFSSNRDEMIFSVEKFGIPVAKEKDLLRASREQISAMKEPPRPFYKRDTKMQLRRFRETYAWIHTNNDEKAKSVWVEKDSFLPLKITGPCPKEISGLSWVKAGDGNCEMEFKNILSAQAGNYQNTRITLMKDGAPILFFNFEKVSFPKAGASASVAGETTLPAEVKEISQILLH